MHVKRRIKRGIEVQSISFSRFPAKKNTPSSHFLFLFEKLDITSPTTLIVKSERPPQQAELLLLRCLRAVSARFSVHSITFVGEADMAAAVDDGSVGVALAAPNVWSHLACEEDSLLVSADAVASAGAQFS